MTVCAGSGYCGVRASWCVMRASDHINTTSKLSSRSSILKAHPLIPLWNISIYDGEKVYAEWSKLARLCKVHVVSSEAAENHIANTNFGHIGALFDHLQSPRTLIWPFWRAYPLIHGLDDRFRKVQLITDNVVGVKSAHVIEMHICISMTYFYLSIGISDQRIFFC